MLWKLNSGLQKPARIKVLLETAYLNGGLCLSGNKFSSMGKIVMKFTTSFKNEASPDPKPQGILIELQITVIKIWQELYIYDKRATSKVLPFGFPEQS